MNLIQLIGMIKSGNPMGLINNLIPKQVINNPMVSNVIGMFQNGDVSGLENFARNIGKEKGIDVDSIYNQISGMFK